MTLQNVTDLKVAAILNHDVQSVALRAEGKIFVSLCALCVWCCANKEMISPAGSTKNVIQTIVKTIVQGDHL